MSLLNLALYPDLPAHPQTLHVILRIRAQHNIDFANNSLIAAAIAAVTLHQFYQPGSSCLQKFTYFLITSFSAKALRLLLSLSQ